MNMMERRQEENPNMNLLAGHQIFIPGGRRGVGFTIGLQAGYFGADKVLLGTREERRYRRIEPW